MEFENFDIKINPRIGEKKEYSISTFSNSSGDNSAIMVFSSLEEKMQVYLEDLHVALKNVKFRALSTNGLHSAKLHAVQEMGNQLFKALFKDDILSAYDISRRMAIQKGKGLRLRLNILAPELSFIPWEYLYDHRNSEYLSLSRYTPVVRYLEVAHPIRPLLMPKPLRILGMVCSPNNLPSLDVNTEKRWVDTALHDLLDQNLIEINWLQGNTWRDLQRAMRQ
ncbi:MAG TPA: hypothetical protein VEA58_08685, partial [Anaerovoracaceae bacterium]|nr:hypothetical protein [Anaerovoracaceae bacterium]